MPLNLPRYSSNLSSMNPKERDDYRTETLLEKNGIKISAVPGKNSPLTNIKEYYKYIENGGVKHKINDSSKVIKTIVKKRAEKDTEKGENKTNENEKKGEKNGENKFDQKEEVTEKIKGVESKMTDNPCSAELPAKIPTFNLPTPPIFNPPTPPIFNPSIFPSFFTVDELIFLREELIPMIEEFNTDATSKHLWALGAQTQQDSIIWERDAEKSRNFAGKLKKMLEEIKEEIGETVEKEI